MNEQLTNQIATLKAKGVHEFPTILLANFSNPDRDWNLSFFAIGDDPADYGWASNFVKMAAYEIPYEACKWVEISGMQCVEYDEDGEEEKADILLSNDSEFLDDGTVTNCWKVVTLTPLQVEFWCHLKEPYACGWAEETGQQLTWVCDWAREFPHAAKLIFDQIPRSTAMDEPEIKKAVRKFERAIRQGLID